MQITVPEHWTITLTTGGQRINLERYSTEKAARDRCEQLQAELVAQDLARPWDHTDEDEDRFDAQFHGVDIDLDGATVKWGKEPAYTVEILDAAPVAV